MIPVYVDFETFWSTTHTLTKMGAVEYTTDTDTEIQSVAIKMGNGETRVVFGEDKIKKLFAYIDWSDKFLIAHNNSEFDSMLAAWRLGARPARWGCTLAMARLFFAKTSGLSLDKVARALGCPIEKGSLEAIGTKGKKLADFSPAEIDDMAKYNVFDTEICAFIFKSLAKKVGTKELNLIDATIRMLVNPQFELDTQLLWTTLAEEKARKHESLMSLAVMMDIGDITAQSMLSGLTVTDYMKAHLASSAKFAALLINRGVEVPMKPSPTNPLNYIPALSKTDEAFIALQEHDDPIIAAAALARLGVKSTLLETRIEKFLSAGNACGGMLPIPLKYAGADTTLRWSGWSFNPQNLPRINPDNPKPTDALRKSLRAPKGKKVIVADLSGIELRVNMFLWKVPYAMKLFQADPAKADLYKSLASQMYEIPMSDVAKLQRQMGKCLHLGCFGANTKVLTDNGIKRIVDVLVTDKVWDGESWVTHDGVIYQGLKETLAQHGVEATSDHEILTERGWQDWHEVCERNPLFQSALRLGNLPSSSGNRGSQLNGQQGGTQLLGAPVGGKDSSTATTSFTGKLRGVMSALRKSLGLRRSGIGSMRTLSPTMDIGQGCSIGFPQRSHDAIMSEMPDTPTTEGGVSGFTSCGGSIGQSSLNTPSPSTDGITIDLRLTGSTTTEGMNPVILGSSAGSRTASTSEQLSPSKPGSESLKQNSPTYDVLNAGPSNRFTVITDAGPIIVHNCGFGVGGAKFKDVAKALGGLVLTVDESKDMVYAYRDQHTEIVRGWKKCHEALQYMDINIARGPDIDPWGLCHPCPEGIYFPALGSTIRYPSLHQEIDPDSGKSEWWYGEGRHRARIYAGKITENIVQHLARQVVADNLLDFQKTEFGKKYPLALTVHDELVYVVDEDDAEEALEVLQGIMRTPPKWWPELVVWSEGDIADTYGDAK